MQTHLFGPPFSQLLSRRLTHLVDPIGNYRHKRIGADIALVGDRALDGGADGEVRENSCQGPSIWVQIVKQRANAPTSRSRVWEMGEFVPEGFFGDADRRSTTELTQNSGGSFVLASPVPTAG